MCSVCRPQTCLGNGHPLAFDVGQIVTHATIARLSASPSHTSSTLHRLSGYEDANSMLFGVSAFLVHGSFLVSGTVTLVHSLSYSVAGNVPGDRKTYRR